MHHFEIHYTRAGVPNHPIGEYREDTEECINVGVESLNGCFNGALRITTFEGEKQIFIHTSSGHYFNWSVTILGADIAPKVIQGPEYKKGTKIVDAFDAISEVEGLWWQAALPKIKELFNID